MSRALHTFLAMPVVGMRLLVDGQPYDLIGNRPHRNRLGNVTTLLVWRSNCPQCGASFEATSTMAVHALNRRCAAHRRPGQRVGGKRRTPVVATVCVENPR